MCNACYSFLSRAWLLISEKNEIESTTKRTPGREVDYIEEKGNRVNRKKRHPGREVDYIEEKENRVNRKRKVGKERLTI